MTDAQGTMSKKPKLTPETRTAYHEAGYAVVRFFSSRTAKVDKGQVHQDHAVAVRGVCASLAKRGGGLFQLMKAEYEKMVAAGMVT